MSSEPPRPQRPSGPKPQASTGTPAQGAAGPKPRRAITNPNVMSAARSQPLPEEKSKGAAKINAAKLTEGAAEGAINAISVAKDAVKRFQARDKYTKYKVFIIAGWAILWLVGMVVAWPQDSDQVNDSLGARLVMGDDPVHPIYLISNESDKPWQDVTVVVNGTYVGKSAYVDAHQDVSFTPHQLFTRLGKQAPPGLRALDLVLRTRAGKAVLLKNGELKQ